MGKGLLACERPREAAARARLAVDEWWWVQFHGMKWYGRIVQLGRHHAFVALVGRGPPVWIRASCCREPAPPPG